VWTFFGVQNFSPGGAFLKKIIFFVPKSKRENPKMFESAHLEPSNPSLETEKKSRIKMVMVFPETLYTLED